MKKILYLSLISILANYLPTFFGISTLSAQVPTTPGNYQWVKGFGSAFQVSGQDERITTAKFDVDGNLIVAGEVSGYAHVQGLGGKKDSIISNHWQSASNVTGFLAKYDCNGNLIWFKQINDSINGSGVLDFTLDSLGNIYVLAGFHLGTANVYWNDSMISAFSWNPTNVGPVALMKVDKYGSVKWIWGQPYQTSGFVVGFAPINTGYSVTPSIISYYNGVISFVMYNNNMFGVSWGSTIIKTACNLFDISAQGQFLNITPLSDSLGFACAGIGRDKNGDFIGIMNFSFPINICVDSTFSRSTASQFNPLSTIIKFNRNHVIRHIEAYDSARFTLANFKDENTSFYVVGGGV